MANFPTLTPSSRTFTPGVRPHSVLLSMNGSQARVRQSNVLVEQRIRLSFIALTEADMLSIRTHYNTQQGRFLSFTIPSSILDSSYAPTGYSWVYAATPQVTDVGCQRYTVDVELMTVPPEGANINGAEFTVGISFTTVTPMALSVGIGFSAGAPSVESPGLDLTVTASLAEGAASGS